ncbi:hypothetical protein NQ314_014577 [Rhamnusium bicolor]|uniref:Peptidase aspartic putative domain-containing protein n=1 Tax=Rhamnusium bicolor TaxID=1586634 RepID=A0AAV8X282_9CUCU|nr:hypothetical protein NQ314_014577 [Rhamnusium bicolor]
MRSVQTEPLTHLVNLPLADDTFYQPGEIEGILGADIFSHILGKIRINGPPGTPMALETSLGFIVMGSVPIIQSFENPKILCSLLEPPVEKLLHKFWEIEKISCLSILSQDDIDCENMYMSTYSRDLTVALTFKLEPSNLGESYSAAHRIFTN